MTSNFADTSRISRVLPSRLLEHTGTETSTMAGIAALKAHLVESSRNEWFQPHIDVE